MDSNDRSGKDSFTMDEYEKSVRTCVLSNLGLMLSSPLLIICIPAVIIFSDELVGNSSISLSSIICLFLMLCCVAMELPIIIHFLKTHFKHLNFVLLNSDVLKQEDYDRYHSIKKIYAKTSRIAWIAPIIGICAGLILHHFL